MSRIIKIIATQFRDLPLNEFLKLVGRNLFLADPILIYACDISKHAFGKAPPLAKFSIERGKISELERMEKRLNPLPWEFQCHTFDKVEDFFVARNQEGIQHISWIYYHHHHNRLLALGAKEAEIKFCLTLPAARGQGVYPRVIETILLFLREKGIRRVFMCVHRDNHSSIRGIEKAGFKYMGMMNLRKILTFQVSKRFATSEV